MLGGRGAGSARSPAFPLLGRKGPLHWWRAPIVGRREQRHDRPARDGRGRARGRGRGRAGDRRALPVSAANIGAVADPPVRELYEPLRSLAMQRVEVALRVAVMVRAGISRGEVAERLGISAKLVRRAIDDLQAVADQVEIGERPDGSEQ
jgi:hypothetical protein